MINKEERRWGYFEVLDTFKYDKINLKTKKLVINKNMNISYQYHNSRSENWYVLEGSGELILDSVISIIKAGDIINIDLGQNTQ